MAARPKPSDLPNLPAEQQIEELERLRRYLDAVRDAYHKAGDASLGASIGLTARRVAGHVLIIRNRIALESACCIRQVKHGRCHCSDGLP